MFIGVRSKHISNKKLKSKMKHFMPNILLLSYDFRHNKIKGIFMLSSCNLRDTGLILMKFYTGHSDLSALPAVYYLQENVQSQDLQIENLDAITDNTPDFLCYSYISNILLPKSQRHTLCTSQNLILSVIRCHTSSVIFKIKFHNWAPCILPISLNI